MERQQFGEEPKDLQPSSTPLKKEPEIMAEHVVQNGETLSHLALKYYGSAVKEKWMVIYEANKELIGPDPNHVKLGLKLKIPKLG